MIAGEIGKAKTWSVRICVMLCATTGYVGLSAGAAPPNTWDGGGADTNWSTKENWSNDRLPVFGPGIKLTFATAGDTATSDAPVTVGLLVLNRRADFKIDGAGTISLRRGIKVDSNTTFGKTFRITAPVNLARANSWQVTGPRLSLARDTLIVSSTISGANPLTVDGKGNVVLSGVNTYTGRTKLVDGTIRISADRGLGTPPAAFVADQLLLDEAAGFFELNFANLETTATFTLHQNRGITITEPSEPHFLVKDRTTFTVAGKISGAGALEKFGGGVLVLAAANAYKGQTVISQGTIRISADNGLGAPPEDFVRDHLVMQGDEESRAELNTTATFTLSDKRGIRLFDSTNVFNVNGETVFTVPGVISESGNCLKEGDGTLVLETVNTYTGATKVNNGKLTVKGDISSSSSLTVANGATLAGDGKVPKTVNKGKVSPGNSTGALTISGDYEQQPEGNLIIAIGGSDEGESDLLTIAGNASVDGGLEIHLAEFEPGLGQVFTVLTTATGISGMFSNAPNGERVDVVAGGAGSFCAHYGPASVCDRDNLILTSYTACPGDINSDGNVGMQDLLLILVAWGPCSARCSGGCIDLDCDDDIGLGDLLVVLASWEEQCP